MATVRQIREHLETLMQSFSTTLDGQEVTLTLVDRYVNPNAPIPRDSLPAYFVSRAGRAEHEKNGDDRFTSRRWVLWIVAAEFADNNPTAKKEADDRAEDLLDPILDFLYEDTGLDDLAGVQGASIRDDGVKEYDRATRRYSALPILIDVASNRNPWSRA